MLLLLLEWVLRSLMGLDEIDLEIDGVEEIEGLRFLEGFGLWCWPKAMARMSINAGLGEMRWYCRLREKRRETLAYIGRSLNEIETFINSFLSAL